MNIVSPALIYTDASTLLRTWLLTQETRITRELFLSSVRWCTGSGKYDAFTYHLAEPQVCHRAKLHTPLLEAAKLMDIKRFIEVHRHLEIEHLNLNFHPDLGVEKTAPVDQIHTDSVLAPVEDFAVFSFRQIDCEWTELTAATDPLNMMLRSNWSWFWSTIIWI